MLRGSTVRVHLRKVTHNSWRRNYTCSDGDGGGESKIYAASRKFARPTTVIWSHRLRNSVSLIGTVEYPPKPYDVNDAKRGVHTILLVKPSPTSHHHFRVTLCMWNLLAERALAHLKPNDYIYVSGQLGSYTKSTTQGTHRLYYKMTATELNYVQVPDESYRVAVTSGSEAGESGEQKHKNQLHLWHLLFANPEEWYDNRKTKKNSRHPDFKHKSTGEVLWLSTYDPPWVKKQVELLDSKLARTPSDEVPFGSFTSHWVSDFQLDSSNSTKTDFLNDISDR
ncbi:hypothetical protein KSS87_017490 [Heliosperma pusillum]|nr:hypothetical protein KSS87_017490 [Heliosperma pusillum]